MKRSAAEPGRKPTLAFPAAPGTDGTVPSIGGLPLFPAFVTFEPFVVKTRPYSGRVTYRASLPRSLPEVSITYTLNPAVTPGALSANAVENSRASPGRIVASTSSSSVW